MGTIYTIIGFVILGLMGWLCWKFLYKIQEFLSWFKTSFEATPGRASARSFSAFYVLILITIIDIKWLKNASCINNFSQLETMLYAHFGFVAIALGLKTWGEVKKNDSKNNTATVK